MRRFAVAIALAALFADGLVVQTRAQSSDDDKQKTRAELVKMVDARLRKLRAELIKDIDQALGLEPSAERPARPDRVRPDRTAKPDQPQAGQPQSGFLGIAVRDLKPGMRELLGVPAGTGLLIDEVVPGSPAQAAGLRRTDVLVSWNDAKIATEDDLHKAASAGKVGDKIKLGVIRESKAIAVDVTLGVKGEKVEVPAAPGASADAARKMMEEALRSGQIPGDPEQIKKLLEGFQSNPEAQKMLEGLMGQFQEMMKDPEQRKQIEEMAKQFFGQGGDPSDMQKRLQDMLKPPGGEGTKPEAPKPGDAPKKDDVDRMLDDLLGQKGAKPGDKPAEKTPPQPAAGFLGISIKPVDEATRAQLGLEAGEGAEIESVVAGGPAATAGVLDHDILVMFDGQKIGGAQDVLKAVAGKAPGAKVSVVVVRKAERKTIEVTLGERPGEWK